MHSDIAQLLQRIAYIVMRSYSHAVVAPNPIEPLKASPCVLYVAIFVITLVLSHFQLHKPQVFIMTILYAAAHNGSANWKVTGSECKVRLQLANVK